MCLLSDILPMIMLVPVAVGRGGRVCRMIRAIVFAASTLFHCLGVIHFFTPGDGVTEMRSLSDLYQIISMSRFVCSFLDPGGDGICKCGCILCEISWCRDGDGVLEAL